MNASGSITSRVADVRFSWVGISIYTSLALIAFAANSILCRLALGTAAIDPAGFTTVRLVSGAITIGLLHAVSRRPGAREKHAGNWISALMLVLYATGFSFAYVLLSAGTGALILFGFVQATMFCWGILKGERPHLLQFGGILIALVGLVLLLLPGITSPSLIGAGFMAVAGIAWGVYSIRGQGASNPVAVTADNFLRSVLLLLPLCPVFFSSLDISFYGLMIATFSGGLASGVGYVVWYQALKGLSTTRAAAVQLLVPVLAALGGIGFLNEAANLNLLVAGAMIISGAGCYIFSRH